MKVIPKPKHTLSTAKTVRFEGSEEQKVNEAWQCIEDYLTTKDKRKLEAYRKEDRSIKSAVLIVMLTMGIQGYYPKLALEEFFQGKRKFKAAR